MTIPKLYHPSEAAKILGVSRSYMYQLMRDYPSTFINIGKMRRIPEEQLIELATHGTPRAVPANVTRFIAKPQRSVRPWKT